MKLRDARSVDKFCDWLLERGISPGENSYVGTVHRVHTFPSSLHYHTIRNGRKVQAKDLQGNLAVDINDRDIADDFRPFDSETECLTWLYHKLLTVLGPEGFDVIDEMFFNGFGFMHEYGPKVNHPIGGHDGHLHIGFKVLRW